MSTQAFENVQQAFADACDDLGLSHVSLTSGAGHDGQSFDGLCPVGMIFVPSKGGASHSAREFTEWEDCVNDANVLLQAALKLSMTQGSSRPSRNDLDTRAILKNMHQKKRLKLWQNITAVILLALITPYVYFDSEKLVLNDQTRLSLEGQFIKLPDGTVHYELAGPPDGQVIVFVHGFSVPYYIWDNNFDALVKVGFRVLRYDLYGRGYSDRPNVSYDLDLFLNQLEQLLTALKISKPVDLVGLSMGGPLVAAFANRHPDQIRSLTLIDPEVTRTTAQDIFPLHVPLLGEYLMGVYLAPIRLPKSQSADFYQPDRFPNWEAKYRVQMQYKGFRRALLSTIRNMILQTDPIKEYKNVGKQSFPVLLLWGREDRTIPSTDIRLVQKAIPSVDFHPIDQAGHIPQYEHPEVVNPILVEFIKQGK